VQQVSGLHDGFRPIRGYGPDEFSAGQGRREQGVLASHTQKGLQRLRFRIANNEFTKAEVNM
jgi:hypothetical protein